MSLSACAQKSVVAVNGTYDSKMTCAEMESLYARNLGTIAEVTEEQLWTHPDSPVAKANLAFSVLGGGVLGGIGQSSAMERHYREQEAQVRYATHQNRKMESLAQEKSCDPFTPTMDTFIAENNERLKERLKAWEEEQAASEQLDATYKREDGGQ